ncbi:MAG: 30S ribosomal protein S4, partial [Candidatus Omnitrophica bacterium]|nr:30S ribosomal protein S4 [Candidatus Omnitrophota bacterium]
QTKGVTGSELLKLLEKRLDNVVYRSGLATTRAHARQMVSHGAITVDGRKVNIPSYQVSLNQVIKCKVKPERAKVIQETYEKVKNTVAHDWLEVDAKQLSSTIKRLPEREDVNFPVEEQLIVELYSK